MVGISDEGFLDLLDKIYSAALDPAAWDPVLKCLANATGCIAGGLTVEDPSTGSGRPLTFFGFDPDHVAKTFSYYLPMNPLFAIEARMRPGFVVTNQMVVETSRFRKTEFYDGWARPQGLCSPLSLVLHREGTQFVPLTLVRPDGAGEADDGAVRLLNTLSPHLIRAIAFGLRLGDLADRCTAFRDGFDALDVGIILLDAADRPVYANRIAELMMQDQTLLSARNGVLSMNDKASDAALRNLLDARRCEPTKRTGEMLVRTSDGGRISIKINPIVPGTDIVSNASAVTMLVISATNPIPSRGLADFARQYRLTARETDMLRALVIDGCGLSAAAVRLGVRLPTAKTHLQRIFEKTGSNRQAELVAQVMRSFLD